MNEFWENFVIEIGFLSLLGMLYYFYQKKKILTLEANKEPIIMGQILQSCLLERGDRPQLEIDALIEAIDDYLHNKIQSSPKSLLKHFANSKHCSPELSEVINSALKELDEK